MPSSSTTGDASSADHAARVGREVALVIGIFLVLGVLGGLLWAVLVSPAEFTKLSSGGAMGENELSKRFGADGWFVVIGFLAALLAGLALTAWRSRDPLLTSLLLVVGAAIAAASMAVVGHLVGPGDPEAALRVAKVGAKVPEALDVDAFSIYLSWPVGALLGASFVLFGRSPAAGRDADPSVASADGVHPGP